MLPERSKLILFAFFFLFVVGCSKSDYKDKNSEDDDETEIVYTPNYKDDKDIYINVKIAIDRYSWDLKGEQFFVKNLEEQWAKINERFNGCDKNNELTHNYIFKPDLHDIITYWGKSYTESKAVDVEVVKRLDREIFNVVVIYDFCYDEGEKDMLAFCGTVEDVTAIACGWFNKDKKGKFNNTFNDRNVHCGITHELGHYRGLVDLYSSALYAENNEVNGEEFVPQSCIMSDVCYNDMSTAHWGEYAINLMNRVSDDSHAYIDQLLYDDFADNFTIKVTKDGVATDAIINCYSMSPYANKLTSEIKRKFTLSDGELVIDARKLYFENPAYPWVRAGLVLLEVVLEDGTTKYQWLVDYDIHYQSLNGIKDIEIEFDFD